MSTFVQDNGAQLSSSGATSVSVTLTSNVTAGHSLIWFAGGYDLANHNVPTPILTDNQGNTYVQTQLYALGGTGLSVASGYVKRIGSTGSLTVTSTVGASGAANAGYLGIYVQERSGINQTTPYTSGNSVTANPSGSGSNAISSGNTPALAGQLASVFGFTWDYSSQLVATAGTTPIAFTARSGGKWNQGSGTAYNLAVEDASVTTSSAVAATFTSGNTDGFVTSVMVLNDAPTSTPLGTAPATDTTSAVGALTTAIKLAGAAADAVSAAGTLTNFASVTLTSPLYTGVGGILDPSVPWDNPPVVGSVIYYDPSYITVLADGEITSTSNNVTAVVQFNDGSGFATRLIVITPLLVGIATDTTSATGSFAGSAAVLAGSAISTVTAAASLTTAIRAAAAAADTSSASGALTTAIQLAGGAADAVTAAGALTTAIKLGSSATDVTSATGALITAINLAGAANDVTTSVGALTTAIQLAAAATDTTSASGGLPGSAAALAGNASDTTSSTGAIQTQILLASAALDTTAAIGALTTAIRLGAAALDAITSTGSLSTGIPVLGAGADTSAASGALTTNPAGAVLAAAATDAVTASATLTAHLLFAAAALDFTAASASISTNILLLGAAFDTSVSVASLTTNQSPVGSYMSEGGYLVGLRVSGTPTFPEMGPTESHVLTFDFSASLQAGETLAGVIAVLVVCTAGADTAPGHIIAAPPAFDATFSQVLIPVVAGVLNDDYYITVTCETTNQYSTLARYGLLQIRA